MREQAWSLDNPDNNLLCTECEARFLNEDALAAHRESEHAEEIEDTSPHGDSEKAEVRPTQPAP